MTLARFHFFPGNSPSEAEDEFPITRRLGANAAGTSVLWAGLGRPETLYIILPAEGRLRLYRGAVLAYREFVQPGSDSLDDKSWQGRVQAGNAPPPPAFTTSFRAEKNAVDILETLSAEASDPQGYRDVQETLEALQSRVTDADLPALIGALGNIHGEWVASPILGGIAAAIAKLNWQASRETLLALVDKDDGNCAGLIASILLPHPEWLNGAFLSADFDRSAMRTRRVYALLLGRVQPTDQTRATLLRALRDDAPAVRWQAALAIEGTSWDAAQKISPLLDRLSDSNELVAAVAALSLGKIGAASVAPILFSNLQQRLEAPPTGAAAFQEQSESVRDNLQGNFLGRPNPFDPDNLLVRGQMGRMRRFPQDVRREPIHACHRAD